MTKEQLFWDWFRTNEANFFFLNQITNINERERILDDFLYHLHRYCDHLFFEIGGHPNDKQDLIISADGNSDLFTKVESLVKHAPTLEYWNIIALKPPKGNFIIDYEGIKLDPNCIYFMPLSSKTSKKIGLRVYIQNYENAKKMDFLTGTYLLLDNLLGERSSALNIGHLEIQDLSIFPKKEDLIEFNKLPKYIKWKEANSNG